jgi:NADPH2:quinone reductase
MKAWICSEPTGVEGLVWQVMPTPAPQPGEVRLAVLAASLDFPDQLVVQGRYQVRPPTPFVPGAESSGVVETVGDGVRGI